MKKFFTIISLLMLISLPILFSPCLLTDICRGAMNFLGAVLLNLGIILSISGFLLYNILFFINNKNDNLTDFQKSFYKKSIVFVLIYTILIISILIGQSVMHFIIDYGFSGFIIILPYLALYLFLIPLIEIYKVINNKTNKINKYFLIIPIILFILLKLFSNFCVEKETEKLQNEFDKLNIGDCSHFGYDNLNDTIFNEEFNKLNKSIQVSVKVLCMNNFQMNLEDCDSNIYCDSYICDTSGIKKATCIDSKCKCNY